MFIRINDQFFPGLCKVNIDKYRINQKVELSSNCKNSSTLQYAVKRFNLYMYLLL